MEARIGAYPCFSMEVFKRVRLSEDAFGFQALTLPGRGMRQKEPDKPASYQRRSPFSRDKYLNWVQGSGFKVQTPGAEPRTLEILSVQVPLCLELLHIRPEQNPYGGELGTSHERSGIACRGSLFLRLKNNI
jgi:hypothetical protein